MQTKNIEESEKETEAKTLSNNSLFASRVGALLDFYSDRAVAHASFFVASVFGLVTTLAIIQQLEENNILVWPSVPAFLAFSYAGYFTLARFGFYAKIAEKLKIGLNEDETLNEIFLNDRQTNLRCYRDELVNWQKASLLFPEKIKRHKRGNFILSASYWSFVFYFGSIVYSKFWNSVGEWISWILLWLFLIFLILTPAEYYRRKLLKTKK